MLNVNDYLAIKGQKIIDENKFIIEDIPEVLSN